MANSVFENAITTIRQAMSAVEAEVSRQSSVEVRAQGAQQHLEALKVQEKELQTAVAELAKKVSETRNTISAAETRAKKIIEDGERRKSNIIAQAERDAGTIREDAQRSATLLVQEAALDARPYAAQVADAKNQLAAMKSQMDAIKNQIEAARNAFSDMKKNAAAFAAAMD